jgi:hypothetical protein
MYYEEEIQSLQKGELYIYLFFRQLAMPSIILVYGNASIAVTHFQRVKHQGSKWLFSLWFRPCVYLLNEIKCVMNLKSLEVAVRMPHDSCIVCGWWRNFSFMSNFTSNVFLYLIKALDCWSHTLTYVMFMKVTAGGKGLRSPNSTSCISLLAVLIWIKPHRDRSSLS